MKAQILQKESGSRASLIACLHSGSGGQVFSIAGPWFAGDVSQVVRHRVGSDSRAGDNLRGGFNVSIK